MLLGELFPAVMSGGSGGYALGCWVEDRAAWTGTYCEMACGEGLVAVQGRGLTPLSLSVLVALPVERRISIGSGRTCLAALLWRSCKYSLEGRLLATGAATVERQEK